MASQQPGKDDKKDDKKDEKKEDQRDQPGPSRNSDSPIPSTSYAEDTPSTSAERVRRLLESVLPPRRDSSSDSHSSEEELENITRGMNNASVSCGECRRDLVSLNLRGDSADDSGDGGLADKRRWSVETANRSRRSSKMNRSSHSSESRSDPLSESSDEEIQGLLANIESNLEARPPPSDNNNRPSDSRSPPTNAQNEEENRDNESSSQSQSQSQSQPQAHASGQAQPPAAQIQRPYLDFEKMQQLKVRTVTAWRYNGDHGELSLYCW